MKSNNLAIPPSSMELEISLFSRGYGEALALHLGNSEWILVDSYLDPIVKIPATLQYLNLLGVNPEKSVKLIIATHWHDDHIRGISEIFLKCESASFVFSNALTKDEFLKLVTLYTEGSPSTISITSGISEFIEVFKIIKDCKSRSTRSNLFKIAAADKALYHSEILLTGNRVNVDVFSLSPSDTDTLNAVVSFSKLIPHTGESRLRIPQVLPNHSSVALWIQVGDQRILLGSDLEVTADPNSGWEVILDSSCVISGQADVFKVSHHGSNNAHHNRIWSQLLSKDPFAILSPFYRGDLVLPTLLDIHRIVGLTSNAFITSLPSQQVYRSPNKVVREMVQATTRNILNINRGLGQIRLRKSINTQAPWRAELFGTASSMN